MLERKQTNSGIQGQTRERKYSEALKYIKLDCMWTVNNKEKTC